MSAWRRSPSALLGLLAAVGCALAPLPAAHAGRHGSRRGSGRELLATAQAQASAGDRLAARATLEQAYRLSPSPEILCALGELAAKDGRVLEAHDARRRCTAARAGDGAPSPAASLPESGELSISGPRRALVVVDEHVVGALPLPLPLLLAPGPHQVALEAGSHRWAAAVKVLPGRAALVGVALGLLGYGGFIELVQTQVPGRTASWADLAADALGSDLVGRYAICTHTDKVQRTIRYDVVAQPPFVVDQVGCIQDICTQLDGIAFVAHFQGEFLYHAQIETKHLF